MDAWALATEIVNQMNISQIGYTKEELIRSVYNIIVNHVSNY